MMSPVVLSALAALSAQAALPLAPVQIVATASRAPGAAASVVVTDQDAAGDPSTPQKVTVVHVRLKRHGDVKDCAVDTSSGAPGLDKLACGLVERQYKLPPLEKVPGKIVVRPAYEGQREFLQKIVWRVVD